MSAVEWINGIRYVRRPVGELERSIDRDIKAHGPACDINFSEAKIEVSIGTGSVQWVWEKTCNPGCAYRVDNTPRSEGNRNPICLWVGKERFVSTVNSILNSKTISM